MSWGLPGKCPALPCQQLGWLWGSASRWRPLPIIVGVRRGAGGGAVSHRALMFLPHPTPTVMFLPTQKTLESSLLPRKPFGVQEIGI